MSHLRFLRRLPAHLLNGFGVAAGIGIVQIAAHALDGPAAALAASGGAVYASLADVPQVPERTARRVAISAGVGLATSLLVAVARGSPWALGAATMAIGALSCMVLAWGLRAGPISFVPLLALVFTMAGPPWHDLHTAVVHAGWTAFGSALYLAFAVLLSTLLQPRYRTLMLAAAMDATAQLVRARQALLTADPGTPSGAGPIKDWIRQQAALDERLQAARDQLFPAAAAPGALRQVALLLATIDLRDTLLASELDLDRFGRDAPSARLRASLASHLGWIADEIAAIAGALRDGSDAPAALPPPPPVSDLGFAVASEERRLAQLLAARSRDLASDLGRIRVQADGPPTGLPLVVGELAMFVSPDRWPLAAWQPHLTLASPILRHALRTALALGVAFALGLALPWASHPHWLVLSVAVVLRGNLEQTLSRRDARIAGTAIGCVLALLVGEAGSPTLLALVFLAAAGIAHAYVLRRYLVTSAAASVMALLQSHLADPGGGLGIGERLADTLLGAALAWAFSYVLPSWERRALPGLVARTRTALQALADQALRWPEADVPALQMRLARREAYDAIGMIAATAQRTGVEPEDVRVPLYALATLLTRAHVLLAHMAAVRSLLARRAADLDRAAAQALLEASATNVRRQLEDPGATTVPAPELPAAAAPLTDWLARRLRLAEQEAGRVGEAARALCRLVAAQ